MGWLDEALQSASNTVAGNVAGPVDLIAWLLSKGGVDTGQAPVMGSEWMKRKGLMRDVPMGAARLAGETAGLIGPLAVAQFAPKIASGLLAAQVEGAPNAGRIPMSGQRGATVWHGSPHKFDKFDSAHIGKGEGAQAYGHGLYLADAQEVAGSYAEVLGGGKTYMLNGKPVAIKNMSPAEQAAMQALTDLQSYGPTKAAYIARLEEQGAQPKHLNRISDAWDRLAQQNPTAVIDKGNLYKVDLPDSTIARMLDWDKPLSQQAPEVQKAIATLNGTPGDLKAAKEIWEKQASSGGRSARSALDELARIDRELFTSENMTGSQLYERLSNGLGLYAQKNPDAAATLRQAGIPGIRYLDGGSRGAGQGTSNYVVFPGEEDVLRILERNGLPVPKPLAP